MGLRPSNAAGAGTLPALGEREDHFEVQELPRQRCDGPAERSRSHREAQPKVRVAPLKHHEPQRQQRDEQPHERERALPFIGAEDTLSGARRN